MIGTSQLLSPEQAMGHAIATRLRITRANGTPNEAVVADEKTLLRNALSAQKPA